MTCINLGKLEFRKASLLITILALSLVGCTNAKTRTVSQIEDLLGIEIAEDASDIRYERVFVSSEFTKPYFAYVQMKISKESYLDLVQQLGLGLQVEKNSPVFVMNRLRPNRLSPDWWDPPDITADLYAAGDFEAAQNDGWIVSAYYNGSAYVKAFEEGTP